MGNLSRRRRLVVTAVGLVAMAAVFIFVWFQPQKLVIDEKVNEALPGETAVAAEEETSDSKATESRTGPALETLAAGRFRALAHSVSGRAKLLELHNGDLYLRFEDFTIENGPDLRVYVANARATSEAEAFGRNFIDLGPLKGNVGDQNYKVPAGAVRGTLNSAVIWCRRFSVGFAVAPIGPSGG
ncbi:MAG: DM13 domain-containing protein [Actinomycetota bacterium]|nr:DM13 domain-containing protein [Actinomycetota bacterium]